MTYRLDVMKSQQYFQSNVVRFLWMLIVVAVFLQGCSGPSGSATLYKEHNGFLASAFPDQNSTALTGAINKTTPGVDMQGKDVYAVFLSDGYFKYLPDLGGVNEVVVVAEFTEVSSGTEGDTVTTVLGPFDGISDRSKSPIFNKLIYGPKKLESDQVSVSLTVIEYDQGENEDAAAFLDFIASASKTFSFVNPVTAAERAFTKEIAKSLLSLNKDDVVLRVSFDLVGNSGNLERYQTTNGSFIPLLPGNYVLVNQEGCAMTTCFGYLSKEGESRNPVAYLGDAALSLPVVVRRGLTDTPDASSLRDIDTEKMAIKNQSVFNRAGTEKFTDKTWLTLSVVQGGDPSLWDKRKLLLSAENAVQRIGKSSGSSIQARNDYEIALQSLLAAQKQEQASQEKVQLVAEKDQQGRYIFSSATQEICLFHPRTINTGKIRAHFYRLSQTLPPELIDEADIAPNTLKTTPNNTCFTASTAAMVAGNYQLTLVYSVGTQSHSQTLNYTIP
ncbi:hypothetical protein OU997_03270 [Pseudomonas sp. SL4(2022)]|uniref:hypothetical protein n=1 Tax=Pseudomonas sp. SL4(2022) TaxID=2994661 RepID=UPI00226EA0D8|nr:hypothetical protein [Pseudomonas sp. SL4(2022)]WAC45229.1 hypothetical protein OU997_03270 [Pseudomonas sp. SL4(2022)]